MFLPHLRLPNPTTCLDPPPARPSLWSHDSFLSSRLDPTRLPYPICPADLGAPDDLTSPVSLLPGNPFANFHLASAGDPREHETSADAYPALSHGGLPFDAAGHGSRQGHLPPPYPATAFAPSVGIPAPPNTEAAPGTTTPSAPEAPRHRPPLPSFFETALYPSSTLPTPHAMSGRKRNSTVIDVPSSSPSAPAPKRRRRSVPTSDPLEKAESDTESDVIDLRDLSKVPEMLLQRQKEKAERVKLGSFQCAICMDYATTLTVTHCGMSPILVLKAEE